MIFRRFIRAEHGLTLTELLIATVTSSLLLSAAVSSFIAQQKSYALQEQVSEMTVNARAALDMITQDIRMAGYGVPKSGLADWVDWLQDEDGNTLDLTDSVNITPGGEKPDTLTLVGCFDSPIADLWYDAASGNNYLFIRYQNYTNRFNTTHKKIFYIGRNEHGIVKISPRSYRKNVGIRIDTDPNTAGNQGLEWRYSDKTPLELLKVITYSVVIDKQNYDTPTPVLKRNEHTGGHAQPLAEYIEDFRITRNGNTLTVALTARAAKPDPSYTHPTAGDGYRRLTFTSLVRLRGLSL